MCVVLGLKQRMVELVSAQVDNHMPPSFWINSVIYVNKVTTVCHLLVPSDWERDSSVKRERKSSSSVCWRGQLQGMFRAT